MILGHVVAGGTSGPESRKPWPFLKQKQKQLSCTGLSRSLKPISVCKRGLQGLSVSTEKSCPNSTRCSDVFELRSSEQQQPES